MKNGMNPPALYDKDKVAYNFGLAIRKLRKEKDMSQRYVATMAGTNPTLICQLECGEKEPRLKDAVGICNALGITVEELVKYCETETNFAWSMDEIFGG